MQALMLLMQIPTCTISTVSTVRLKADKGMQNMTPFSRAAAKDAGPPRTDLPPLQEIKSSAKNDDHEGPANLRRAPVISVCCFFLLVATAGLVMVFSVNKVPWLHKILFTLLDSHRIYKGADNIRNLSIVTYFIEVSL